MSKDSDFIRKFRGKTNKISKQGYERILHPTQSSQNGKTVLSSEHSKTRKTNEQKTSLKQLIELNYQRKHKGEPGMVDSNKQNQSQRQKPTERQHANAYVVKLPKITTGNRTAQSKSLMNSPSLNSSNDKSRLKYLLAQSHSGYQRQQQSKGGQKNHNSYHHAHDRVQMDHSIQRKDGVSQSRLKKVVTYGTQQRDTEHNSRHYRDYVKNNLNTEPNDSKISTSRIKKNDKLKESQIQDMLKRSQVSQKDKNTKALKNQTKSQLRKTSRRTPNLSKANYFEDLHLQQQIKDQLDDIQRFEKGAKRQKKPTEEGVLTVPRQNKESLQVKDSTAASKRVYTVHY